jgi:hypothetical protein
VWAQMDLGHFPRSGFYDFVMFNLLDHGKEAVNKVLDIVSKHEPQNLSSSSQGLKNSVLKVKSVKGRMIVQPPHTR